MIKVLINGEEVISNKQFTIKEEILSASSTILNNCYPKSWEANHNYVNNFYFPSDYSKCEIYDNSTLIFAGIVKNSGDISLRPTDPKYCSLQILDYKCLLSEGTTLDFVIANSTINDAIRQVISAISSYGFVEGNIQLTNGTDIIGAYSTLNQTAYDVFQYLADISESRWFTRRIDEDTIAIDFYSPEYIPQAQNIEYNKAYFEANHIVDLSFNFGTRDYRNKQAIISDKVYGGIDYNETIISNGYNTTINTTEDIGAIKSIEVNGVAKTFTLKENQNIGIYADFYYTPGSKDIECSDTYAAGNAIVVSYTPLIKGRQVVIENDEVARIQNQLGRNGVISRYEQRNDILDSNELNQVAQAYITYKGKAEILLKIQTENYDILNVGQQVFFDIAELPILQQDYLVKSKSINITKTGDYGNIFYEYELSSNFNSESAINYFDNQRRKAYGNIDQGKFITRNIDITSEALIEFQNQTEEEITVLGNNELNCTLNSPFIE
jgi:hypothetical protein